MTETPQLTTREASRRTVRRLTKTLAALALVATGAFGAAAASATKHPETAGESNSVVDYGSWDDGGSWDDNGYGLSPPSQGVSPAGQSPSAISGGS